MSFYSSSVLAGRALKLFRGPQPPSHRSWLALVTSRRTTVSNVWALRRTRRVSLAAIVQSLETMALRLGRPPTGRVCATIA